MRKSQQVFAALVGVGALVAGFAALAAPPHKVPLQVVGASGIHELRVEIAATPRQHTRGLMWREVLAPDAGMLFLFDPPRETSFYMKNTLIALDIIFIAPNGRIHKIVTRDDIRSEEASASDGLTLAVLELNGGRAAELGITTGDAVRHPRLKTRARRGN